MDAYNSIPYQYYSSDYSSSFSPELCSFPTCDHEISCSCTNDDDDNNNRMALLMNYDINSPVSVTSFPCNHQQFGFYISDRSTAIPQMSEIVTGFSNFAVSDYQKYDRVFESGDQECIINRLVPNFYASSMPAENWALQGNPVITKIEDSELVKVGRYSAEEKKERILRYLKKKNHRNFNKTIKYACRKTLADKRVRVRGRFAKNQEPGCEEDIEMNITNRGMACYEQNNLSFDDDSFQMKNDEDCWLQVVMANFMHLPYNCLHNMETLERV